MTSKHHALSGFENGIWYENIRGFRFKGGEGPLTTHLSIGFFQALLFSILLILLARLFWLAIISGDRNRAIADGNRIQLVDTEAPRGSIFDRNGTRLATSAETYLLKKDFKTTEISQQQASDLEKQGLASENFEGELGKISRAIKRDYPLGETMAHVLGYISQVSEDDLKQNNTLKPLDSIGRLGIEATYDNFLRGTDGKKLIEVDSEGKKVSILGNALSKVGRDLTLTIDSTLQKVAFDALKKQLDTVHSKAGAVVVQVPSTGEVLALVSLPSFDAANINKSIGAVDKPFFNRAIQGTYPPGSVFKIVSALAGLESGAIAPDTEIEDVGEFYLGDVKFSNWYYTQYGLKDGIIKLDRAIARSNDIFFYRLAERAGLDEIRKISMKFGFGQITGIDLPAEGFGLLPDGVWKESTLGVGWYPGDTMHLGIGQGFILVTPMQINSMNSYMASGKLTKPHLVSKIGESVDKSGNEVEIKSTILAENLARAENFNLVRDGMRQACAKGGTAWPFFEAKYSVGCKTGTAEKSLGNPHAWFSAFAPLDQPNVAITVLVEDGGEGSSVAAPVAKEILDWWFANRK